MIRNFPLPLFVFKVNFELLRDGTEVEPLSPSNEWTLIDVGPSDGGEYTCVAQLGVTRLLSSSVRVSVTGERPDTIAAIEVRNTGTHLLIFFFGFSR